MTSTALRLLGAHEVRVLLGGISRQRAYQITNKPTFPKPLVVLEAGKVWSADEVEAWIAGNRGDRDGSLTRPG